GYRRLSYLPENFVYNTGNEHPLRRLVSTFLSPLATSYLLVVTLLLLAARGVRGKLSLALLALLFAGLLWTHSRSSYLALAAGLTVLALARRRWEPLAAAAVVLVAAVLFVKAYPHIAPETSFTAGELRYQRHHAHATGGAATSGGGSD